MSGAEKRGLLAALAPTSDEIRALARRETDPAEVEHFQPICRGPVMALLLLGLVGLAAVIVVPFRLLAAPFRRPGEAPAGDDAPRAPDTPSRPA